MKETPSNVEKLRLRTVEHAKEVEEVEDPLPVIVVEDEGAFQGNSLQKLLLEAKEVKQIKNN